MSVLVDSQPLACSQLAHWTLDWAKVRGLATSYFASTTSTNTIAKDRFCDEPFSTPILFLADEQVAGRGRGSHTWLTPGYGQSLLSTWCFPVARTPQPVFSPRIGLGVFRAARAAWPELAWSLKAPNDIYLGDKKICGILIEIVEHAIPDGQMLRCCVIGIGFNVFAHPEAIETATSLTANLPEPIEFDSIQWQTFLSRLDQELRSAVVLSHESELSPFETDALKLALNAFPLLPEPISHVTPLGEIQ
jgi:BirA family biotin operon repressor/biotin-[acetyl-CoA-carboxylase] ligase